MIKVGIYKLRCTFGSSPLFLNFDVFGWTADEAVWTLKSSGYKDIEIVGFDPR